MFSIVNELSINSFKYVINYVRFIYRYLLSFFEVNSVLVKEEFGTERNCDSSILCSKSYIR